MCLCERLLVTNAVKMLCKMCSFLNDPVCRYNTGSSTDTGKGSTHKCNLGVSNPYNSAHSAKGYGFVDFKLLVSMVTEFWVAETAQVLERAPE